MNALTYRDAMSRYAGHVQIITVAGEGARRGVTITAACSVSDRPPMVLACVNNENVKNQLFFASESFCLNTLAARHEDLARAFAGYGSLPEEERFALAQWERLVTGAPVLADALAAYDCRIVDRKQTATHTVLFGEVVGLKFGDPSASLLYLDRGFHSIG
ncbi:flavin reductase family protein [Allorhizobium sp. BGMRC 0089]|uniref:flavin reductase family protein n=1 Tax=Allorhizobium sonneratiae TaxID=2934936 RepID=UPI0020343D52|nr:flavin reductase family protein [Allorhizobium sonneratiae]